jgi:uncharacterized protein (TIGR03067 family)
MRHPLLVLVVLFLATILGACGGSKMEDSAMLNGTWIPIDAELGGRPFPGDVLKTLTLVVKDGQYTVDWAGVVDKGTLSVEPTANPKTMDITGTEGPSEGRRFFAIYEFKGDTLRICYDVGGTDRPTEFKTAVGTQQFLVNYRRQEI